MIITKLVKLLLDWSSVSAEKSFFSSLEMDSRPGQSQANPEGLGFGQTTHVWATL
jgi:hypothetical protein